MHDDSDAFKCCTMHWKCTTGLVCPCTKSLNYPKPPVWDFLISVNLVRYRTMDHAGISLIILGKPEQIHKFLKLPTDETSKGAFFVTLSYFLLILFNTCLNVRNFITGCPILTLISPVL